MNSCIFCKIIKGDIPSEVIWEDDSHIAILDINPNIKGQALVIPKSHLDSDILKLSNSEISKLMIAVKKVSNLLKRSLDVERVGIAFEGVGVDHSHVKLYPMIDWKYSDDSVESSDLEFYEKYPGYLTTKLGPACDMQKLSELANQIRSFLN